MLGGDRVPPGARLSHCTAQTWVRTCFSDRLAPDWSRPKMPDVDSGLLSHFRELHLLPRTIFAIGAALFTTSLFSKNCVVGFSGVGIVFFAVAWNMLINAIWTQEGKRKDKVWKGGLVQMALALVFAFVAFGFAYHFQPTPSR